MKRIKLLSCLFILGALVGCNSASNIKNIDELNTSSDIVTPVTFTLSVEATNGTVEGNKEHYAYGEVATLSATPDYGYKFVAWQLNGTVLGEDTTLNYTVIADKTITAVFLPQTITYAFIEENETTYLSSDFFTAPIDIIGRMPYDVVGKIVQGWSEAELVGDQFVVYAVYTDDLSLIRTVTIDGFTHVVNYGTELVANANIDGFTHWRDQFGNVISYSRNYKFKAVGDIELTQSALSVGEEPTVALLSSTFVNGKLTCDLTVAVYMVDFVVGQTLFDLGISEVGVVLSNNPNFSTTQGLVKYQAESVTATGQFTIAINSIPSTGSVYAKGYAIYFENLDTENGELVEKITSENVEAVHVEYVPKNLYDVQLEMPTTGTYKNECVAPQFVYFFFTNLPFTDYTQNGFKFTNDMPNGSGFTVFNAFQYTTNQTVIFVQKANVNPTGISWSGSVTITSPSGKIYYAEFTNNPSTNLLIRKDVPQDSVASAKTDAKAEILSYKNTKNPNYYNTDGLALLDSIYNDAIASIDASVSANEISAAVVGAKKGMDNVPLDLTYTKGLANTQLDAQAARVTDAKYASIKDNVDDQIAIARGIVENATTVANINLAVQAVTTYITNSIAAADLAAAINTALSQFTSYFATLKESDYTPENWIEVTNRYNAGVAAIGAVTSISIVTSTYTSAVNSIEEVAKIFDVVAYRATAIATVTNTYNNINKSLYSSTDQSTMLTRFNAIKNNINSATDAATIDGYVASALATITQGLSPMTVINETSFSVRKSGDLVFIDFSDQISKLTNSNITLLSFSLKKGTSEYGSGAKVYVGTNGSSLLINGVDAGVTGQLTISLTFAFEGKTYIILPRTFTA